MRRLSLSHLTVLEVGPPDLITLAADAGFPSVGIRLNSPLPGGVAYPLQDDGEVAETRRRMADRGVEVLDVEVVRLGPETLVASYAAMFDTAAELGAKRVGVNIDDPDRARSIDRFAEVCHLAAGANLSVDLEFMIWRPGARLEDAVEVVATAGRRNSAILIDALHLIRSGGSVAAVAGLTRTQIGCIQLCDAPTESPESSGIIDEARGNRLLPGEGALPLLELLAVVPGGVPLCLEVPMARSSFPPLERARRVHEAGKALLQKSEIGRYPSGPHARTH